VPGPRVTPSAAALGAFIADQRKRARLSMRSLAQLAGVSNPYLSQIERGLRKPSAEILQQLARALEISSETLYVQAGFLDSRGRAPNVLEAIRADAALTPEQKASLVQIYESFVGRHGGAESTKDERR
jgi:transcriptional regulator with XRE-family HTH domain